MNQSDETLLEFPCEFSIKAMGKCEADFDTLVAGLVRQHVPDLPETAVKSRTSKGGKWLAVTVTIQASSKNQLDAIYRALSSHEKVVMAL